MRGLLGDLHFAWRAVVRHPGFVVLGLLTLALGIGANTAIFAVLDSAVIRPLPYPRADRLVSLRADRPFTLEEVVALQEGTKTFSAISGYRPADLSLTGAGDPEIVHVGVVSASHWGVLGTVPILGRSPSPQEELSGAEPTVVLSDGLWKRRFGADPGVLGRRIALEGPDGPFRTVIGVMPAGYRPLDPDWQAWIPAAIDRSASEYRGDANLQVVARLAPGSDLTAAASEVAGIVQRLNEKDPGRNLANVRVTTLHERVVKDSDRMLALLLAAMSLVLLIACANVANLLLAWAETRRQEAAVRSALGAGRGRLIRQILTESVMLGVVGGAGGLVLARAALAALVPRLPSSVPQIAEIGLDGRVLFFALGSAVLCGVVFGALPAWKLSRELPVGAASAGATSTARWRSPMSLLVTLEIGLCLTLLAAAGLMLKSLWLLERQDPGFAVDGVITLRPQPSESRYGPEQRYAFTVRVLERLEAVPGVDLEGAIFPLPMGSAQMAMTYTTKGGAQSGSESPSYADLGIVSPGVFSALGVGLLEGRDFTSTDRAGGAPVAIVSRSLAREAWPSGSALERSITAGGQQLTVVGVVADVRQQDLDRGRPVDRPLRGVGPRPVACQPPLPGGAVRSGDPRRRGLCAGSCGPRGVVGTGARRGASIAHGRSPRRMTSGLRSRPLPRLSPPRATPAPPRSPPTRP